MSRQQKDPLRPLRAMERVSLVRLSRSASAPAAHCCAATCSRRPSATTGSRSRTPANCGPNGFNPGTAPPTSSWFSPHDGITFRNVAIWTYYGAGVQAVDISVQRVGTGLYWNGSAFSSGFEDFQAASFSGGNWSYAFPASSFPADGSYAVHIRAHDNAGNTETGPSRSFTIDSVDPNTTVDSGPADPSASADAAWPPPRSRACWRPPRPASR